MINSKNELHEYLLADSKNYIGVIYSLSRKGIGNVIRRVLFCQPGGDQRLIWLYIYCLRHAEYSINCKRPIGRILWLWMLRRLSYKLQYQIPPNVLGKGVTIYHWGSIIINSNARIGENCILQPNIVIGQKHKGDMPMIGSGVNICSGARIIGNINVGNNVTIAPNAVVVKDVPDNCVVGGIPAKILRIK